MADNTLSLRSLEAIRLRSNYFNYDLDLAINSANISPDMLSIVAICSYSNLHPLSIKDYIIWLVSKLQKEISNTLSCLT